MATEKGRRGLGDLRTSQDIRFRSRPARKGDAFLDLFLLGIEKQRLERDLTRLGKQQKRAQERLAQVLNAVAKRQRESQAEETDREISSSPVVASEGAVSPAPARPQWETMPLDY